MYKRDGDLAIAFSFPVLEFIGYGCIIQSLKGASRPLNNLVMINGNTELKPVALAFGKKVTELQPIDLILILGFQI